MTVKVFYSGTQAEVEALTGVPADATAYATDSGVFGQFDGTAWQWGATSAQGVVWGDVGGDLINQADLWYWINAHEDQLGDKMPKHDNLYSLMGVNLDTESGEGVVVLTQNNFGRKTASELVDLLKPVLDTLYEPKA